MGRAARLTRRPPRPIATATGPTAAVSRCHVATRTTSTPRQHYVRASRSSPMHRQSHGSLPCQRRALKPGARLIGPSRTPNGQRTVGESTVDRQSPGRSRTSGLSIESVVGVPTGQCHAGGFRGRMLPLGAEGAVRSIIVGSSWATRRQRRVGCCGGQRSRVALRTGRAALLLVCSNADRARFA